MRQRTGLSVELLSELRHAADQSGSSIQDLENGIRKMQREIGKAGPRSLRPRRYIMNLKERSGRSGHSMAAGAG